MTSKANSFFFQPIVSMEVFQEISRLNANKSPGPENIPIKFYKTANKRSPTFLAYCTTNVLRLVISPPDSNVFSALLWETRRGFLAHSMGSIDIYCLLSRCVLAHI